ncbi:hypothetical protein A3A09_02360 [Candidatus Nomurabacteria bacterium RIFCSPLOWO2_01_FULL_42_20]|uniref:PLD phosphodiesterase domain-containing protein n=1 Tax=Candidatus Nomurabacteria bacterium RIFCSPHIGHO2_01_FULL_42_16 TaxID=1801743 RepID=A0A1F6VJV4_9BACT|nr:MAG: hypothetical protein A2824_01375 [Candidatus Nomurabacteria bacterium RIFCSPHIGHO2_01_FULL_42_16]OGI92123.1 MAG: hypothetical protein A3A09_02360 [Candidatus Nomurabacteria bacterium RIFCSPLOWO2_01_FULL_42_20]
MLISKKRRFKDYQSGNKVSLVKSGEEYFKALLDLIDGAKESIHLQTYILSDDNTGRSVAGALKKAARRNVAAYVVLDLFGSFALPFSFVEDLRQGGVQLRFFSPFLTQEGIHLGRRLHRKVLVADGKKALISGINITDRYRGSKDALPWLDFGVLVEGEICSEIFASCEAIWGRKFRRKKKVKAKKIFSLADGPLVRVRQNDWMRRKLEISKSYKDIFRNAEKYITIVGAYFLPGRKLKKLIKAASGRGVKIRLILSKNSDEKMFKMAALYLYEWLFRHGVEIYEYQPVVVHGKAAVADDIWTTIGSHDLNFLSTYGMVEMNLDIWGKDFAESFNKYLNKIIKEDCVRIAPEEYGRKKKLWNRIIDWWSYYAMRISLWLLVLLTNKRQEGE